MRKLLIIIAVTLTTALPARAALIDWACIADARNDWTAARAAAYADYAAGNITFSQFMDAIWAAKAQYNADVAACY